MCPTTGIPDWWRRCLTRERSWRTLRGRGLATGVLSNQSGVARGFLSRSQVDRVNDRMENLLGPFDVWEVCPHGTEDGCGCRKPAPGMIHSACRRLGIAAAEAAYIGDIGSDMEAAEAAGARGILVPTAVTRPEEVAAAGRWPQDLAGAVSLLLGQAPVAGPSMSRVLVARLDSVGDVLLAGPAVRAVANGRRPDGGAPNDVVMLCGPQGEAAAIPAAGRGGSLQLGQPVDHEPRPGG